MIGKRTDNAVENSQNVQQAGGNIHNEDGVKSEHHTQIVLALMNSYDRREDDYKQEVAELKQKVSDGQKERGEQLATIARLTEQIEDLRIKKLNPEAALSEELDHVARTKARLTQLDNYFDSTRIAEAKAELDRFDFTKAEEIFNELDRQGQEQQAFSAFALGEIAEARVDWAKAATHYGRAAELAPDYDRLKKAREFAWRAGDYASADRLGQALLDRARGEGSQEQLSGALNAHALTLRAMGRYEEAEPLYRQALDIGKDTLGTAHPDYATGLNNLGLLLSVMGRYEEAEPLFRQALDITKDTIGTAHPAYAIRLNNLGLLLSDMGRYEEAEPLFRQALDIGKDTIGTAHPDYAIWLNNLAVLYYHMERYAEAEPLMQQALSIREAALPEGHPDIESSRKDLTIIRKALNKSP